MPWSSVFEWRVCQITLPALNYFADAMEYITWKYGDKDD